MPGRINFYLKKAEKKSGLSLIYLKFKYNGRVLVYAFGQTINPSNWSQARQRVKSNRHTTQDGKFSLNDLLDNLELECTTAYNLELKTGIPNTETLKQYLNRFINQNEDDDQKPTLYSLADKFIDNEIHHKGKNKATETIKKYVTVKNHLIDFEKEKKYKIDFDTVTLEFYHKYLTYLKDKKLKQNTIAKDIQVIKTWMAEAVDLGYTSNIQFRNRKFSATWEEVENVYLSNKEIIHLYNYDLSQNVKLDKVKDLFVFGCFTGLRFGDYSSVKPENIVKTSNSHFIKMKTQKTGEQVIIPCNPIVLKIFEKYSDNSNKLPKAPSNQKFNQYIKEACKKANLTDKGRLLEQPRKELWECVSSHTARRSFATNLYLEGFPSIEIMKITGHTTEKAFLKYIKVSKLDAANRLEKHIQLKWSEKLLQIAG